MLGPSTFGIVIATTTLLFPALLSATLAIITSATLASHPLQPIPRSRSGGSNKKSDDLNEKSR